MWPGSPTDRGRPAPARRSSVTMHQALLTLALVGVAATAAGQTLPSRVLRPEPTTVLVRYSASLAPEDRIGAVLITWTGFHSPVEATVTSEEVVVTLSSEDSRALAAVRRMEPPGAAFLLLDALTLGGRVQRNLIAPVPMTPEVRIDGAVRHTTWLHVDYMPPALRPRSLRPEAWVVTIDDRVFPVTGVDGWPSQAGGGEAAFPDDATLQLTLDGSIPYGATATVAFRDGPDAEPRLLASGTTPDAPPGRLARFINDLDVYTGFMFTNSAGTDATFGLVTRFQRPYLFAAFGPRNQVSIGPRASLTTNSWDQDDENSLLLSAPVEFRRFRGPLIPRPGAEAPLINTIVFDIGPTLESEKRFRNHNLVSDGQLAFQFSTLGRANLNGILAGYALDIRPHVGFEAGRSLGSPIAQRVDTSILRLKAGVTVGFRLEFQKPQLQAIVFDVDYVYRQLYADETFGWWATTTHPPEMHTPVAGVATDPRFVRRELFIRTGKQPRRYLNAALRFVFSRYWEVFASYVRGALPPRFVRVNKMQAGFAFRFGTP